MNVNVTNLIICSNSCNELKSLNLNEYKQLKSIEIGNHCFMNVGTFKIDGLNHLKSLKIGNNSFNQVNRSDEWDDDTVRISYRSFYLLNCIELKSIEIGKFSFYDYSGGFELRNLPKLSTIKLGTHTLEGRNGSSLVMKGDIDLNELIFRSSESNIGHF